GSGRGMAVIDVGMGRTRAGRLDRVIPTVGLVQVGQGPAAAVVHALTRIGDEGDTLPKQGRFRELGCLRTPAADGVAGLLCFGCIDARPAGAEPTPDIVADVDRVPSTTFNTVAVVVVGSAATVGGD